jgi:hypothetical protein
MKPSCGLLIANSIFNLIMLLFILYRVIRLHMIEIKMLWNGDINPFNSISDTHCSQRRECLTKFIRPQHYPLCGHDRVHNGRPILPTCGLTSPAWFAWKLRQSLSLSHQCPEVLEHTQCSSETPIQRNQVALGPVNLKAKQWAHRDQTNYRWTCCSRNHGLLSTSVVVFHLARKRPCSCFSVALMVRGTAAADWGMVSNALSPQRRKWDRTLCRQTFSSGFCFPISWMTWGFSVPHMMTFWEFTLSLT